MSISDVGLITEWPNCIVNADDLGINSTINSAIAESFKRRWISSASVMANMPGFEEACHIAHEYNLTDKIGIHIVLSVGQPLTDAIKRETRFCNEDGLFRLRPRNSRFIFLSTSERKAVIDEVAAQIAKCHKGWLRLTHLDSHHHFHEEWGIIGAILPLIRQCQIPRIRIMRNMSACSMHRRLYAIAFNARLRRLNLSRSRHFGTMDDFLEYSERFRKMKQAGVFEIMVHPTLDEEGRVIDAISGTLLTDMLERNRGKSVK